MTKTKLIFTFFVGTALLVSQVGSALAAPNFEDQVINGTVTALACANEEGTSILVTYDDSEGVSQQTEVDLETAVSLGLATVVDGETDCSEEAFQAILDAFAEEEPQHPVGAVLASFFGEITDYDTIMEAHANGSGFGVIAQALWLTTKMESDSDTFLAILQAKKDKDFSAFKLEDGSTPSNWGQFKKAVLNGDKKNNLGAVMSDNDPDNNKTNNGKGPDKEKSNNGKGPDKDKNKNKGD